MEKHIKLFLILLIGITITSCTTNNDIDISKYPIISTVKDLTENYDVLLDSTGKYENSSITMWFDGSSSLDYTYELLESEEYDPLFYSITIDLQLTKKDAIQSYTLGKGGFNIGNSLAGHGTIEIDSLDFGADQSYYAIRTIDGDPNGIIFIIRKGKNIYTLIVSGLNFPNHSLISDLVLPRITNLESFKLID